MDKKTTLIAAVAIISAFSLGQSAQASVHDLSNLTGGVSDGQRADRCLVCHPRRSKDDLAPTLGLMWDRNGGQATFATYTLMDGRQAGQPSASTKLCLSCHDGTVGNDEWEDRRQQRGPTMDLMHSHPVSIPYNYDAADNDGLNDPRTTPLGEAGVVADYLPGGMVECVSCHDVHKQNSVLGTPLLLAAVGPHDGRSSELCLACHRK